MFVFFFFSSSFFFYLPKPRTMGPKLPLQVLLSNGRVSVPLSHICL